MTIVIPEDSFLGRLIPSMTVSTGEYGKPPAMTGAEREPNFLQKLSTVLRRAAEGSDPEIAQMNLQREQIDRQRQQESALAQLGAAYSRGEITDEQYKGAIIQAMPSLAPKLMAAQMGIDQPADVKSWLYRNNLPDEQRAAFDSFRRNQQVIDTGSGFAVVGPGGSITPIAVKDLPPEKQPQNISNAAAAQETGKVAGEKQVLLKELETTYPELTNMVNNLSELGKKATYTKAGKFYDAAGRQLGADTSEGAAAREKYLNTVKTNILPLLRQTFGAQFTAAEGDKLLETLGDVDKSPDEKDAALAAFIEQKESQIRSTAKYLGVQPTVDVPAASNAPAQDIGGAATNRGVSPATERQELEALRAKLKGRR